jgi:hypothetical protein
MRFLLPGLIFTIGLSAVAPDARAQARMELVPSVSFTTTYDDNIFTTQAGGGDAMMLVAPAIEAFYESPTASLRGLYTFDMQRAMGYSTLNSVDAKRHAVVDTGFQVNHQFRISLIARYDVTDRPGDLMFDTGVLLGRQRASRYQLTPAIAVRVRPRTTLTAQYDATKEALGEDMRGDMYIARFGVSRMRTPRDTWSLTYLGRTFVNGADLYNGPATERSHTALVGYSRAIGPGSNFSIQGGPRVSSYGNRKPELMANFSRRVRIGKFGLDYWQGETIIMGIRGPVDLQSATFKSTWPIRRSFEVGGSAGIFRSKTLQQGEARVFHPELVGSYSPGGPYILAASYGIDFQRGDVRSQFLSDKQVVRHVLLVRMTFAPRLSHNKPSDPTDRRSKGVTQ